jgi:hypothetical protein
LDKFTPQIFDKVPPKETSINNYDCLDQFLLYFKARSKLGTYKL